MEKIIAIDTPILIYLLQEDPHYYSDVRQLFEMIEKGQMKALFSIIGMIELFTGVLKKGRNDLVRDYKLLLSDLPHFEIYSIDETIVDLAAQLRAKNELKTPDAIHIATAIAKGADYFLTNDRRLKKIKEIKIITLNDIDAKKILR